MIYVMSGGLADAFAVIAVTYPSGSTCSCTNGTKTLKAKDTSGRYLFLIPEAGAWTVSCTDGSKSKSKTLNITASWQSESVVLNYELVLFDAGAVVPMSKGFSNTSSSGEPTVTIDTSISITCPNDASLSVLTNNKVNLSEYNTMYVTVTQFNAARPPYSKGWIIVDTDRTTSPYNFGNTPQNFSAIAELSSVSTGSLDISSLSGEYYAGYGFGIYGSVTVSKIWIV